MIYRNLQGGENSPPSDEGEVGGVVGGRGRATEEARADIRKAGTAPTENATDGWALRRKLKGRGERDAHRRPRAELTSQVTDPRKKGGNRGSRWTRKRGQISDES